jgi:hypothetical protein
LDGAVARWPGNRELNLRRVAASGLVTGPFRGAKSTYDSRQSLSG